MPRKKLRGSSGENPIKSQIERSRTEELDYMFISINHDNVTRNEHQQRSHVMQNYLKRKSQLIGAARLATRPSKPTTTLARSKMTLRQGVNGLEQRQPYWYGKKSLGHIDFEIRTPNHTDQSAIGVSSEALKLLFSLATSPLLLFRTRGIDAFGVLPISISRSDEVLLDMVSRSEQWPWCPTHSQDVWQPFALSDELALHVTLYIWSWSFQQRLGTLAEAPTLDLIRHKVSSLALINARLSDPTQAVKDETIAAVAAMTTVEVMRGTKEEATKHMNGLRILVAMRGGFATFASAIQLLVLRLISWTDLIYSELHELPLSFPVTKIYDEAWETLEAYQGDLHQENLAVELPATGVSHHEVTDVLHTTSQLCHAERMNPLGALSEQERMKRGDMFHSVERRLRVYLEANALSGSSTWECTLWRAVALADLIFVHHSLRGSPPAHVQFRTHIPQLQQSLLRVSDHRSQLIFAPALLLWMLSVGVIASPATSLQPWFIRHLANACKKYPVHSKWHNFQGLLSRFLWTGEADEQRYWGIWQRLDLQEPLSRQ